MTSPGPGAGILLLTMLGFGFGSSSIVLNYMALSPEYSTPFFAVGSTIANTGSALGPVLVGCLLSNQNQADPSVWLPAHLLLAGTLLLAFTVNVLFGKARPHPELNTPVDVTEGWTSLDS